MIFTGLIFPLKKDLKDTPIKHGFLYIKKSNGYLFTYFDINSVFKDKKTNIVFNEFYALFHFVYWICFLFLYFHHRKGPLKKEALNV